MKVKLTFLLIILTSLRILTNFFSYCWSLEAICNEPQSCPHVHVPDIVVIEPYDHKFVLLLGNKPKPFGYCSKQTSVSQCISLCITSNIRAGNQSHVVSVELCEVVHNHCERWLQPAHIIFQLCGHTDQFSLSLNSTFQFVHRLFGE